MRPEQLGKMLGQQMDGKVEDERPKLATVTSTTNQITTGEIKCALASSGDVIWVDAGGNVQALAAGDYIWVQRFGVGVRSQYKMVDFFKSSGGDHAPGLRADIKAKIDLNDLGDVTISSVADRDRLTYDSGSGDWINEAVVDLNGLADGLVLDADGDTTLSAPTDDQIDVEVGGADVAAWKAGGLYHAAGGDVFPNGGGRGLARRMVNPLGLAIWSAHFRTGETTGPGNGTLAAYSWQGAPLGGTPSSLVYSLNADYLATTADGAGVRHFLSRAITNAAANWQTKYLDARIRTGITTEIGVRFDAGDDNNWVEMYMTGVAGDATQRLDFRYRDNGGAVATVSSALIIPVDRLVTIALLCYWSGAVYMALGYVIGEEGTGVNIATFAHTLTGNWAAGPPAAGRSGIVVKEAGNYGICDWFYNELV